MNAINIKIKLRNRISPDEQEEIYKAYKHGEDVAVIMVSYRVTYEKLCKILQVVGEFTEDDLPAQPTQAELRQCLSRK